MTHNKNPTSFHHPMATPEFTQTQLHKPSYKSNPTTNPATKFTHNTQNKSIPRINQKLQDLTHNKSNQNLHKPSYKSISPLQTKNTQKLPPYHADLTSQSHLHAGPTTHARKAHRERETWWEREAVVVREPLGRERNEKRNKGRERVRKQGNRKII